MTLHTWSCLCLERRCPAQVFILEGWTQSAFSHLFSSPFYFPVSLLQSCHGYLQYRPTKLHRWEIGLSFFPVKWYILEEGKQINSRWAPQRVRPCLVLGTVVMRVSRILSNKKCNCPDRAKGHAFPAPQAALGMQSELKNCLCLSKAN